MGGQKVLIAVDGSEQAEKAFKWYLDNLYQQGDYVILAHIADTIIQGSFGFRAGLAMAQEEWQAMLDANQKRVTDIKTKFGGVLNARAIRHKFIKEEGEPGNHLVNIAKSEAVTLVVMGTRGLGTMRRTVLGSVSDYLLHHVHTQVCICRD